MGHIIRTRIMITPTGHRSNHGMQSKLYSMVTRAANSPNCRDAGAVLVTECVTSVKGIKSAQPIVALEQLDLPSK
jgi:hypothetical protein